MNTNKYRLDITESESITELMRFKKKSEKVKKSKIKKEKVLSEYVEQQINNKEYYHWSSKLTVLILIGIGDA